MNAPCDWDQESYCINGDGHPATHRQLTGMIDDSPIYEMICCTCADPTSQTIPFTV